MSLAPGCLNVPFPCPFSIIDWIAPYHTPILWGASINSPYIIVGTGVRSLLTTYSGTFLPELHYLLELHRWRTRAMRTRAMRSLHVVHRTLPSGVRKKRSQQQSSAGFKEIWFGKHWSEGCEFPGLGCSASMLGFGVRSHHRRTSSHHLSSMSLHVRSFKRDTCSLPSPPKWVILVAVFCYCGVVSVVVVLSIVIGIGEETCSWSRAHSSSKCRRHISKAANGSSHLERCAGDLLSLRLPAARPIHLPLWTVGNCLPHTSIFQRSTW